MRFHFISTRLSQGVHHLLSTRNNNFSNRSQKATIVVLAAALLGGNGDGTRYTAAEALEMGFVDEVLPIGKKASKTAAKNDRSGELAARARLLRAKSG